MEEVNIKTLIVAMDKSGAIGFEGDLPWGRSLKGDLAHFKQVTTGGSIIMGRKTFESIGNKPLPNRENIVLSSKPSGISGVLTAVSLSSAYALARYPIFVIGGAHVYRQALDDMDELYITYVDAEFAEADTHFPEFDKSVWIEQSHQHYPADQDNKYPFDIIKYAHKR